MQILVNLDLAGNQLLNALAQVLASDPVSPTTGQFWFNSTSHTLKFYNGSAVIVLGTLDQISKAAADVDINSHKLINVTDPTGAQDAATKNYVDNAVQGLSWKETVRVATTAAGTLASDFANGQSVDSITLATGDRILIKNQADAKENGIYVVKASGAPDRADDATPGSELVGAAVYVQAGTGGSNAGSAWVCSSAAPITIGASNITFVQFGGGLSYSADETSLTLSGTTFSIKAPVSVANGGTNATTAAAARTSLGATGKYGTDVGDNSNATIAVTHNLGTTDVVVLLYNKSTKAQVYADVVITDSNNVTLTFATAPTTNQFRCVVVG